ncbi:MAG: hypothetical protein IKC49_02570 [Clostridia bacterium]|nr:hypothetical protein [Clostridia bacterium]
MRKIVSLILLVLLMPCVMLFNGCGDKGYKLSNAPDKIASLDQFESVVVEDGVVKFNYDSFTSGEQKIINDVLSLNIKPYTYLKDYNKLFNNLMTFTCAYLDECANDDIKVNKDLRNELKRNLEELEHDIANVNTATIGWSDALKVADDISGLVSLTKYKNLLTTYDDLFNSAANVANTVSNIYFEYVLNDANPNYYDISLAKFDAGMVANKLQARILDQISKITQVYIEKTFSDANLAEVLTDMTTSFGNLDLTQYNAKIMLLIIE